MLCWTLLPLVRKKTKTKKVGLANDNAEQHADSKEATPAPAPSLAPLHPRNIAAGAARGRRVSASIPNPTSITHLQLPNRMGAPSVEEACFTHGFKRCEKSLQ
jgi:hypothetical protein